VRGPDRRTAFGDDHVHALPGKLLHDRRRPVDPALDRTALQDDVAAIDQPEVAQSVHERAHAFVGRVGPHSLRLDKARDERNPRHAFALLAQRARRRQDRDSGDDELPPGAHAFISGEIAIASST